MPQKTRILSTRIQQRSKWVAPISEDGFHKVLPLLRTLGPPRSWRNQTLITRTSETHPWNWTCHSHKHHKHQKVRTFTRQNRDTSTTSTSTSTSTCIPGSRCEETEERSREGDGDEDANAMEEGLDTKGSEPPRMCSRESVVRGLGVSVHDEGDTEKTR